jgi:hypothetical protein
MSKSKKSKTIRKEVKKEVKALKKASKSAPKARKAIRAEVKAATRPIIRGRGGYFGDLGGKIGNIVDVGAGLVKTISGLGEYKVKSNSLLETGRPPVVRNTKYSSTITGHPEYICDIVSSVDFKIQKFSVNPGIPETFPWLSPQTAGYEQYKAKGVLFEYRSTCGDAIGSTDNAMGVVLMGSEYNVNLPPFANKQQMEDHEYTTSVKPSENALHPIECAKSRTVLDDLYVRTGAEDVPDLKFYDQCNFYIATQGQQTDGVTIGELWVTYEYEFLKPTLNSRTVNTPAQHWYWDSTLGSFPNSTYPLRNLREVNTGRTTSSVATSLGPLPAGKYIANLYVVTDTNNPTINGSINYTFGNGGSGGILAFSGTNPGTGVPNVGQAVGKSVSGSSIGASYVNTFCFDGSGPITISTFIYVDGPNILNFDLWLIPVGSGVSSTSRRPIDYDPLAVMKRRMDEMYSRLCADEARWRECANDPTRYRSLGSTDRIVVEHDEDDCKSPCSTPVEIDVSSFDRTPQLTRSQINIADLVLDRINGLVTSKTGSHVRAA